MRRGGWAAQLAVPQHRFTPLKESWLALYKPVTEQLKLDMRMNLKTRKVEIKTTKETAEVGFLQKAADFVQAFILGFDVADAIALLRLDDLYLESFEIKDVKVNTLPSRIPPPRLAVYKPTSSLPTENGERGCAPVPEQTASRQLSRATIGLL